MGIEPEEWWSVDLPYRVEISFAPDRLDAYDVAFYHHDATNHEVTGQDTARGELERRFDFTGTTF